jgi:hypothetical protein
MAARGTTSDRKRRLVALEILHRHLRNGEGRHSEPCRGRDRAASDRLSARCGHGGIR